MPAVVVTGITELDRALAEFDEKVQKKYVRKALNNSIKFVEKDFKQRCPVGIDEDGNDTGVMRDSTKRSTPKKKKRWQFIRQLVIDKAKLMALYFEKYGRFPGARRGDSEPFFYPAVIELGDKGKSPKRPLRGALYGNEDNVRQEFIRQLQTAIANPKAPGPSSSGADEKEEAVAVGATVYRDSSGRYQKTKGGFASKAAAAEARAAGKLYEKPK